MTAAPSVLVWNGLIAHARVAPESTALGARHEKVESSPQEKPRRKGPLPALVFEKAGEEPAVDTDRCHFIVTALMNPAEGLGEKTPASSDTGTTTTAPFGY